MIKMNNKIKNYFGIGDMFFSLMVVIENAFLMVFLTDVVKLPLAITATIITITSLGDLITSFIAGGIVDKLNFKWGKYRSWLLLGPVISTIFFVFEFTKIGPDTTVAIIFTISYVISHFIWNIFYTANRALAGAVTDDPTERAHISGRISAWMNAGRIIGSKLISFLILFFATTLGGGSELLGYTYTAIFTGTLMVIGYYIHYSITKGYDEYKTLLISDTSVSKVTIWDMFKGVGKNPPLISVLICDFIRCSGYYTMLALVAYYSKIVLQDQSSISNMLLVLNIGCLVGSLFSKTIVMKFGTKITTIIGMIGSCIFMVIAMFFSPNQIAVMGLLSISQIFFGISFGLTTSLYANCATYAEYKTNKNTAGFIMGLISFSIKVSMFFRGVLVTGILAIIGYNAEIIVSDRIVNNVTLVFFLLPTILIGIGVLPLLFLKMTDSDVISMRKKIEEIKIN